MLQEEYRLKSVEALSIKELFDRLSVAVYYGTALQGVIRQSPAAWAAAKTLVSELRNDDFLRERIEHGDN
jgi:hypothetical protein